MNNQPLIQSLGSRGERLLKSNRHESDDILVKLKGAHGEGLVVTSRGIYVLKWGFMTGNTFGGRCGFFDYRTITGVDIRKSLMTGIFEVLTPAHQNTQKGYWNNSAASSDNVISFFSSDFKVFQEAARITREGIANYSSGVSTRSNLGLQELEKLVELRDKGILTEEEFQAQKKKILGS